MAREKCQALPPPTGLREAMAAEYRQRADRPGYKEFAGHCRAELAVWESGQPVEVAAWELPPEHRPPGADDYDRYRVGPAGKLTLVSRHADEQQRLLERLRQLGRD